MGTLLRRNTGARGLPLSDFLPTTFPRYPGWTYPVKGGLAMAAPSVEAMPPELDRATCAVTTVCVTPTVDRQGEILEPMGGVYDDFAKAPIILFDHRMQYPKPIAKAADETGNLQIFPSESYVKSKHYFRQDDPFAMDIFRMIDDGFMPGVSVGFDPVPTQYEIIGSRPDGRGKALHYYQWKLLEISHTPLGVNPDALTVYVQKGKVGDKPMHPLIKKSLSELALPTPAWATGWTPPVVKAVTPKPVEKAMPDPEKKDDDKLKKADEKVGTPTQDKPMDKPDKPEPKATNDKSEPVIGADGKPKLKPSAKMLMNTAQCLRDAHAHISKGMDDAEHEPSMEAVEHVKTMLQEAGEHVESALAEHHPEVKAEPPPEEHDKPENDDPDQGDAGAYKVKSHQWTALRFGPLNKTLTIHEPQLTPAEEAEARRQLKILNAKIAQAEREQARRRA